MTIVKGRLARLIPVIELTRTGRGIKPSEEVDLGQLTQEGLQTLDVLIRSKEITVNVSPESPVLTLHIKAAERRPGVIFRLFNANDQDQTAEIGSGFLRILSAQWCDLPEKTQGPIEVQNGTVTLNIPPRRVTTVFLHVEASGVS